MKIYISGISGTGMGPLALMAKEAGFLVSGSDLSEGAIFPELVSAGIDVEIGSQDGNFLKKKLAEGVDWFVYTSALPEDHPELVLAKKSGIKISKRDDLTAFLVKELGLKMVAVAGTHGKTTTTSMIVWAALKLNLPVSYIVGTTLGFAPSGAYHKGDKYFVYEADEYDRNFLKFHPWLSVVTVVSYDHSDIYQTRKDYEEAFLQFESQSKKVIKSENVYFSAEEFNLAGEVRRVDASFATSAICEIEHDIYNKTDYSEVIKTLDEFPGVGRRFEKLAEGIYTDYAHHPEEIATTLEMADETAKNGGLKGVVAVYQPHQNTRQHEVRDGYKKAFLLADKILWLPTYLTRENPELEVLSPEELISELENRDVAEAVKLDDELFEKIVKYHDAGYLVILLTAGPADGWLRNKLGV